MEWRATKIPEAEAFCSERLLQASCLLQCQIPCDRSRIRGDRLLLGNIRRKRQVAGHLTDNVHFLTCSDEVASRVKTRLRIGKIHTLAAFQRFHAVIAKSLKFRNNRIDDRSIVLIPRGHADQVRSGAADTLAIVRRRVRLFGRVGPRSSCVISTVSEEIRVVARYVRVRHIAVRKQVGRGVVLGRRDSVEIEADAAADAANTTTQVGPIVGERRFEIVVTNRELAFEQCELEALFLGRAQR